MLDYWQFRSVNPGNPGRPFHAVVFGNGRYVSVGDGGMIFTSPDGVSWTDRNSSAASGSLKAVAYGNGKFIAAGHTSSTPNNIEAVNRLILTSTDGITWNRTDTGLTGSINGVAHGNGIFVAVGSGGWVQTSTDCITWNNARAATNTLYGISFASDKFVAVGGTPSAAQAGWLNYHIMTSVNGVDWVTETVGGLPEGTGPLLSVAYGKDTLVAVGGRHILKSKDNGGWTSVVAPVQGLASVAYGKDKFVAVGRAGKIVSSEDGSAWTERNPGFSFHLSGISYGGHGYVAVSSSGAGILQAAEKYSLQLKVDQSSTGTGTLYGAGVHDAGLNVPVSAAPDANSTIVSWGGDCLGYGQAVSGMLTMDGPKSCTILFDLNPAIDHPVKKGGATYIRLQEAFDNVEAEDEVILHMSGAYAAQGGQAEHAKANSVTLIGGYDTGFSGNDVSFTTLKGSLSAKGGALTVDRFVIQ